MGATPDRIVGFVLDQLVAFYTLRREFDAGMPRYTTRLRAGAGEVAVTRPTPPPHGRGQGSGAAEILQIVVRWVRRLPLYVRQHRLLRQPLPLEGAPPVVIATSSRRLHVDVGPRELFVELTRPFAAAADPGIHCEVAAASRLLVSDVIADSPLWVRHEECWRENVFILDNGFLLYLALAAVARLRVPLLWGCIARLADYRRRRGTAVSTGALIVELVAAGLLLEAYHEALPHRASFKAYFLTSNSFATEVLRFQLFVLGDCAAICEVMHGIPTTLYERFVAAMLGIASRAGVKDKHSSISQLPDLPMFGSLVTDVKLPPTMAINTYLNRYWLRRAATGATGPVTGELRRLFAGRSVSERTLVVSFFGGTSQYRDPYDSETLLVERLMMQHAIQVLKRLEVPYILIYTPHPSHGVDAFKGDPFFADEGVVLFPDTVLVWLVCDLAIGLISSALFEAAYFGAQAFTPTLPSDDMYPSSMLDLLYHPAETGRDALINSMTTFLERFAAERQPCDLFERAGRRAAREHLRPTWQLSAQ